jgi:hypothetical protein
VLHRGWADPFALRSLAGREWPLAVATLSLGAAAIHFAVIREHFDEFWLFGLFFAGLGWYQALWALLYVLRPAVLTGLTAVLVNGGAVAMWVWTRTIGLPIGPEAGKVEAIGAPDLAATAFEVAMVLALAWLIANKTSGSGEPSTSSSARVLLLTVFVAVIASATAIVLFLPPGRS